MHKKNVVMISLSLLLLSGCAMNEKIEEIGNRESLPVLKWQFGIDNFNVRKDVMDEELIKEVEEVFAQVDWQEENEEWIKEVKDASSHFDWDFQKKAEDSQPVPQYQIGTYEIWIHENESVIYAMNLEDHTYAKLTEEDSECIIQFLMQIGVAH